MKELIVKLLRELRFHYDIYLPLSRKNYISITKVFDILQCDDEAIICREFRANFPQICISDDGQEFSIKKDLNFDLLDSRTLYVEADWSKVENIVDLANVETVWHSSNGSFHFITFNNEMESEKALISHLRVKSGLRWMRKMEWNNRMIKYEELMNAQISFFEESLGTKTVVENRLEYLPGVIGCFSNVNPNTDRKTIKRLFEMIAPVRYVDYNYGECGGYVRFKTSRGAQLAQNFFSRCCIIQTHEKDFDGFLDPHRSTKHHGYMVRGQETYPDAITLYVLQEQEDCDYWSHIFESQKLSMDQSSMMQNDVCKENVDIAPAVENDLKRKIHVKFDSSDLDTDDEEHPEPIIGEAKLARKPRHRKQRLM
jgi:hypothetical protein